jgi:hypothetical protein
VDLDQLAFLPFDRFDFNDWMIPVVLIEPKQKPFFMQQEFPELNAEEKLKAENDFLKMKLMLERGGQFESAETGSLPPEVENQFLNQVMAFEQQFENRKFVKIYDKVGRPQQFKPVAEIPDAEIDQAWKELDDYLEGHGISVDVCSPQVPTRELYRFVIEELFEHETDDINLPGWSTHFIYDEFHQDPIYENSRMVKEDLLGDIFSRRDLFNRHHYVADGFSFNGQHYPDFDKFAEKINRFKSLFEEVELESSSIDHCDLQDKECRVIGQYKAISKSGADELHYGGIVKVDLIADDSGYWDFKAIDIEGFKLE